MTVGTADLAAAIPVPVGKRQRVARMRWSRFTLRGTILTATVLGATTEEVPGLVEAAAKLGLTHSIIDRATWPPPELTDAPLLGLGCAALESDRPLRILAIGGSNTRGAGDLSEEDAVHYAYWALLGRALQPRAVTTVASPRGG